MMSQVRRLELRFLPAMILETINYSSGKYNIKMLIPCIKTRVVEIILIRNNYWYTVLVLGNKIGECMV